MNQPIRDYDNSFDAICDAVDVLANKLRHSTSLYAELTNEEKENWIGDAAKIADAEKLVSVIQGLLENRD